jgi:RNA polymerase sigma factor (sigma-70 family)
LTGDRFDEVVRDIRPSLVAIAQRAIGNRHDAEDVVQNKLLEVWGYSQRTPVRNLKSLLYKAVKDGAIQFLWRNKRKNDKRQILSLEEEFSEDFDDLFCDVELDPGKIALHSVETKILRDNLRSIAGKAGLTEKQWRRLWLCDAEGLSHPEIAAREGCKQQASYMTVKRARLAMQRVIEMEDECKALMTF